MRINIQNLCFKNIYQTLFTGALYAFWPGPCFRSMSSEYTVVFISSYCKVSGTCDNDSRLTFCRLLQMLAARHTCYAYGIGLMGPYDFGAMSPYTMIDTAAVISIAMFTFLAFVRSWIVRTLVLVTTQCIVFQPAQHFRHHLLFYAILPFSAEFLHAHKLYVIYLYGNMLLGTLIFVVSCVWFYFTYVLYIDQSNYNLNVWTSLFRFCIILNWLVV